MPKQEIFEDDPCTWRVNSAPFMARRLELGLSLRRCAEALNRLTVNEIDHRRLWEMERRAYFYVDTDMRTAIKRLLDIV